MADGTKVQINDLADFSRKTAPSISVGSGGSSGSGDTLTGFMNGLGDVVGGITKGTVAGSGLGSNEAQTFCDWYTQSVSGSATQCVADAQRHLTALSRGALVMAGNYAAGDASQAKAMKNAADFVMDMFSMDPSKGLDAEWNSTTGGKDSHPPVKELPPPTTTQDPVQNGPETPGQKAARQATEHDNKYGKDETWPKPPDPPKTRILAPGPIGQPPPSTGVTA